MAQMSDSEITEFYGLDKSRMTDLVVIHVGSGIAGMAWGHDSHAGATIAGVVSLIALIRFVRRGGTMALGRALESKPGPLICAFIVGLGVLGGSMFVIDRLI